jgi:hypothetical protein
LFDFIQELNESRIFRYKHDFRGMTARDLGHMLYQVILMLEIIRHYDKSWVKQYANKTYQFAGFPGLKAAQTDMYNLISVVNNQDSVDDYLKSDKSVSVPEFGIKRYLLDIINDRRHITRDRELLLRLESSLQITDGKLKDIRRLVSYWDNYGDGKKKTTITNLRQSVRLSTPYLDIYSNKFKNL